MIEQQFWDDINNTVDKIEEQVDLSSNELLSLYGDKLSEGDLLKLCNSSSLKTPIKAAVARNILQLYMKKSENYNPKFLHQHKNTTKSPWNNFFFSFRKIWSKK